MIATGESVRTRAQANLNGVAVRADSFRWFAPIVPLVVAAVLNMWNLVQNGYSNTYYSVAVQSMLQSWKNFFFAAYDAGSFITVDKPPVALWIQTLSAKLFGFNGVALLLPEALAGIASVAVV